jgi:hypothetical protein
MNGAGWAKELQLRLQGMGAEIEEQPEGMFLARLTVRGGVFRHPLTRQPVDYFLLYAAGVNRVKILSPRFLWSLEAIELDPAWNAEGFFAAVAGRLGQALQQLDTVRRRLAALGLVADLQPQVLQLRGQAELGGHRVALAAGRNGQVVLLALDGRPLHHLERSARSHTLGGAGLKDLEELSALAARLGQAAPPPAEEAQVVELTEEVVERPQASWLSLGEIVDKFGPSTRLCVVDGVLHFQVTLRVVQGEYQFWLQQQTPAVFRGFMQTPAGQRVAVSFELEQIMDLKDILDGYLRGS